jgi:hypothetical protein
MAATHHLPTIYPFDFYATIRECIGIMQKSDAANRPLFAAAHLVAFWPISEVARCPSCVRHGVRSTLEIVGHGGQPQRSFTAACRFGRSAALAAAAGRAH